MRYLVTGGAGFIGSHLSEALVARGDEVVAFDDMSTGREHNVSAIAGHPSFRLENGDILDADAVDKWASECDVIVHLAAAIGVRRIVEEPLRSMRINIRGTEIVLEAAHRHRCKTLIASTSEVYGKSTDVMHEHADRVLGPTTIARWSYSAGKAIDEHMALAYWLEENLPTVIVRFFNTVGTRQTGAYAGVLPRLVSQALNGEDLTIYGDGNQTRCYSEVTDVVRAVVGLLDHEAAVGEPFNIGSEDEISVNDLAQRIIQVTGSSSRTVHIPFSDVYGMNYEDIPRRVPDTTKVRNLLGWAPAHDLTSIIERTVAYAQQIGPKTLLSR